MTKINCRQNSKIWVLRETIILFSVPSLKPVLIQVLHSYSEFYNILFSVCKEHYFDQPNCIARKHFLSLCHLAFSKTTTVITLSYAHDFCRSLSIRSGTSSKIFFNIGDSLILSIGNEEQKFFRKAIILLNQVWRDF